MKIVLVDDHSLFREALKSLLITRDPSLEIVGEAATARDALVVVEEQRPELVLMDLLLRGTNGVVATRDLRHSEVKPRVLILTAVTEPGFVIDALAAGAQGYALKEQSIEELLQAIQTVGHGGSYLAPSLVEAVQLSAATRLNAPPALGVLETLSAREREVFDLVVAGFTNVRLASELFISVKTVETHRSRINKKLRIHSTGELIRFAAMHGLLAIE